MFFRIIFILLASMFFSCKNYVEVDSADPIRLAEGGCTFLTSDHQGNPVISFLVQAEEPQDVKMYFNRWNSESGNFDAPAEIPPAQGAHFHEEGMPKIAFKSNGEMIAVFGKKNPTPANPYSALVYYTQSTDGGKSWTAATPLVVDTSVEASQRFYDIATLSNGEVGITWLDSRKKAGTKGSTIYYASTTAGAGFGDEKQIGESTCECCRTDLYVDQQGFFHVSYRDILSDSIRDVVHTVSVDEGNTFSSGNRISADNWVIDGCPHTGPAMAKDTSAMHFIWFTDGGEAGVYYCSSTDNGNSFSLRELISTTARHPEMTTVDNLHLAMVYEERVEEDGGFLWNITVKSRKNGSGFRTENISGNQSGVNYPAVVPVREGKIIVAWRQEQEDNKTGIFYKIVKL